MRTLEVLIEKDAFSVPQPLEVVADTPVSALVPTLVDEFHLPQTDLFGQRLNYRLRPTPDGDVLPENITLARAGITTGTRLTLEASVAGEGDLPFVPLMGVSRSAASPGNSLHSSQTMDDDTGFSPLREPLLPQKRQKRSRRAFLVLGGLALAGGGVAYAGARGWLPGLLHPAMQSQAPMPGKSKKTTPPPAPAKPHIPNSAKTITVFAHHQGQIQSVRWSPDGQMIASGGNDAHVYLWQLNGTIKQNFQLPAAVSALAWAPDGQRLAVGANTQVTFFNTGQKTMPGRPVRAHTGRVTSLAWAGQGGQQVVSGGLDRRAIVWDSTTYRPLHTFLRHTTAIESVTWNAAGDVVASSSLGGVIRVWRAATVKETHGLFMDAAPTLRAVAFEPGGMRLACAGSDGVLRIWNGEICQQPGQGRFGPQCMDTPMRLPVGKAMLLSLAWSPDGRFIAVGAQDGTLTFFYPQQSQKPLFVMRQGAPVTSVAWSQDGKHVVTATGQNATVWELL